jgi:acetyl esterase/lipase
MISKLLTSWSIALVLLAPNLAFGQKAQQPGIRVVTANYGRPGAAANLVDLYLPNTADKPFPVVMWVHGGGWEIGDKENPPAIYLTTRGFAVASINYRLSGPQSHFPDPIYDCKAAVRWLRGNAKKYDLDADHIGVWGGSAGGHLVALLGTSGGVKELEGSVGDFQGTSSRVQAVCDWFGPTDLVRLANFKTSIRRQSPDYTERVVCKLLGTSISKIQEPAKKANPITYVASDNAPFLIMHGDKDNLVPIEQSELLSDALKRSGAEVDFRVVPGAGHEIRDQASFTAVEDFFNKRLKTGAGNKAAEKPTVIATYDPSAPNNPPGEIKFYSNGCLNTPQGPSTWILKGGILKMYWYSDAPAAPSGIWIDTCNMSTDHKSYIGKNNKDRVIIGKKISGDLRGVNPK